jgi:hypothetical protein
MKLVATSILALALAAPPAIAQTTEDRSSPSTSTTKKDMPGQAMPKAGTSTDSSTSDRGSMSTSSSTTSRDVAASTDTAAKDKECKCDCSQQGAMKSKRRAAGRSATDSSMHRSAPDQTRPAAPATGPVDSTHTGSTTDTSKAPGTGDNTMKPSDSSSSSSNPSDNAPKK